MSKFTGSPATGLDIPYLADTAAPVVDVGQVIYGDDGRKFIYVQAGITALVAGNVVQTPAEDTGDEDITPVATAIGLTTLVTSSTMTVTKNQYAGGYVVVTTSAGISNYYRISQHAAFTTAAATFILEDPIQVALTSGSRLDFVANPYKGVIVAAVSGSMTGAQVGVAVNDITASQYGWVQTSGPGAVLNDANAAITVGQDIIASASVAGSVRLATAGIPAIGRALSGAAASQSFLALLKFN